MKVEPYLFFDGRCEEAAAFYEQAIGAQVTAKMRYSDSPEPPPPGMVPPGNEHKIMHMNLKIGDSVVMAADECLTGEQKHDGFSLTLQVRDTAEAERCFNALAEGGQVKMPLQKTFWTPSFGMLTDRFGIGWMVLVDTGGAP